MKSAGVLTFFRPINYGAVLQAAAMQRVLESIGYHAEVIDYRFPRIERYRRLFRPEEYWPMRKSPGHLIRRIGADILYAPARVRQKKAFDRFLRDKVRLSARTFHTRMELEEACQQYDVYVVGSDLVWNPEMAEGVDPVCFLNFVQNRADKRLVAYAPSIGLTQLEEGCLAEYERLLRNLDAISVREASAARLLQPLTEKKVEQVLDPTLLMETEGWRALMTPGSEDGRYVLSFMVEYSPLLIQLVKELADREGLTIIHFDVKQFYGHRKKRSANAAGPDEFLWLVQNAEHVVTNSFHGCAFSLLFHRDLWCIPHTQRGTRMTELLNSLGIGDRIVTEETDRTAVHAIDYGMVDERLRARRGESLRFLRKALTGKEDA